MLNNKVLRNTLYSVSAIAMALSTTAPALGSVVSPNVTANASHIRRNSHRRAHRSRHIRIRGRHISRRSRRLIRRERRIDDHYISQHHFLHEVKRYAEGHHISANDKHQIVQYINHFYPNRVSHLTRHQRNKLDELMSHSHRLQHKHGLATVVSAHWLPNNNTRPYVFNGHHSLWNKPRHLIGSRVLIHRNAAKRIGTSHVFGDYLMPYEVAKTSRGGVYYKVVSYNGKMRGWVYKRAISPVKGLSRKVHFNSNATYYLKKPAKVTVWAHPLGTAFGNHPVLYNAENEAGDALKVDDAVHVAHHHVAYHVNDSAHPILNGWVSSHQLTTVKPSLSGKPAKNAPQSAWNRTNSIKVNFDYNGSTVKSSILPTGVNGLGARVGYGLYDLSNGILAPHTGEHSASGSSNPWVSDQLAGTGFSSDLSTGANRDAILNAKNGDTITLSAYPSTKSTSHINIFVEGSPYQAPEEFRQENDAHPTNYLFTGQQGAPGYDAISIPQMTAAQIGALSGPDNGRNSFDNFEHNFTNNNGSFNKFNGLQSYAYVDGKLQPVEQGDNSHGQLYHYVYTYDGNTSSQANQNDTYGSNINAYYSRSLATGAGAGVPGAPHAKNNSNGGNGLVGLIAAPIIPSQNTAKVANNPAKTMPRDYGVNPPVAVNITLPKQTINHVATAQSNAKPAPAKKVSTPAPAPAKNPVGPTNANNHANVHPASAPLPPIINTLPVSHPKITDANAPEDHYNYSPVANQPKVRSNQAPHVASTAPSNLNNDQTYKNAPKAINLNTKSNKHGHANKYHVISANSAKGRRAILNMVRTKGHIRSNGHRLPISADHAARIYNRRAMKNGDARHNFIAPNSWTKGDRRDYINHKAMPNLSARQAREGYDTGLLKGKGRINTPKASASHTLHLNTSHHASGGHHSVMHSLSKLLHLGK